ncbi:MAG: hypothetical protein IK057_05965 [Clostridia bacterium]|nr:hypothetical protein [Clostridia bacterium]
MKINRFFIPLLVIFAFLLCGCGRKKEDKKAQDVAPKTVLSNTLENDDEMAEETPKIITYKVLLDEKVLSLYEVNGESKKLITKMEINPENYPETDIAELKKGIDAYCKEDGYEILENFAN